jgi:hypothetical protein
MPYDTALIRLVIKRLTERQNWTYEQAMEQFYNSETCNLVSDRRTGLFTCAPIVIAERLEEEKVFPALGS